MTWASLYPWLLLIHVLAVFAFLAIHGVSMGVWWRVRRERDRAKLAPLLELSAGCITPMSVAGVLLIASGTLVGIAAGWWFNGQWWLWVSIGALVAIVAVMTPLLAIPMGSVRKALDVSSGADDAVLEALLTDRRPTIGASIAIAGIVLITWLMEAKPF